MIKQWWRLFTKERNKITMFNDKSLPEKEAFYLSLEVSSGFEPLYTVLQTAA